MSTGWGFSCAYTGCSSLSKLGIGCGSKRVSGIAQRSISRSNTDSAPKKKEAISTKPSTRPVQVWSQVMAWRKWEKCGDAVWEEIGENIVDAPSGQ